MTEDGAADDREARLRQLLSVDVDHTADGGDRPPSSSGRRPSPASTPPARRATRLRTQQTVSAAILIVLFALGGGLVWAGATVIRSSTEGDVVTDVQDPTAPGYEAILDPTPTLAVLHDLDGTIDSITVLTLPDPDGGGGGVIFVPTRVVVDIPVLGTAPIEAAYDMGTASVQADAVGDLLNAAIQETAVVDADRWAGLVAPVAPLHIDNPDNLEVDGEVVFPVGDIALEADQVAQYLELRVPGESDLARLYRHQLVWQAWIQAVAASDRPDAVPGELSSGIGRFVRTLSQGPTVYETLPVTESASDEFGDEPTFQADVEGIADLVARLIPFPASPRPGVRPRVRVLNGTSDTSVAQTVAPQLPPAGVEVVMVGNASSLDHEGTTIAYVLPEHRDDAEAVRDALGYGEVIEDPRPSDVADITVTLGADHD